MFAGHGKRGAVWGAPAATKEAERFEDKVDHVDVKDLAPKLAGAARGTMTGIGMSRCAIGKSVRHSQHPAESESRAR